MDCSFELKGFLGKNPELKTIDGSKKVCNFSVAEKVNERTIWHNVECWGEHAVLISENFKKGDLVLVEGLLAKDNEQYRLVAKQVAFLPKFPKKALITNKDIPL